MKSIYFFQANDVYGDVHKSVYFPYAAGCIQAFCMQDPIITSSYRFEKIFYTREPLESVFRRLKDPFMVLFSCSVWNIEYNKTVAAAIKKVYPKCFITFGGHSISSDGAMLEQYAYIDFLTHRFGEEPTAGILSQLASGGQLSEVPNISFRNGQGAVITTRYEAQAGTDYPSPYLLGVFDDLLDDPYSFSGLMETNRGCPNSCSFCDWGSLKSKVRLFSMERVKAEIDWFVSHKIEFIFCADANFCLFKRDAEIADYIVSCKEKYGYPKIFRVCFTKNRLDFVFEIGSKFVQHGLEKAQTLSFQSLNDQVLENIGRKNIPISLFRDLMEKYNRQNITTFTELILGLPGETYDSFCQGVCSLLENGQHFAINIYPCELLPNAEMGQLWYREKFNIRSSRIPFRMIHSDVCQKDTGITEYVEFVTSTYSMDSRDWIRSLLFASVIQGLHNLGILRAVAVYCRYECRCDYQRFYQSFVSYAFNETTHFIGKLLLRIQALCNGVLLGQNSFVAPLDGTDHVYWGFDELIFLESYRSASLFFADVKSWLENTFGANEIWDPLLDYQFAIIKKINRSEVIIRSDYDFYTFFTRVFLNAPQPLEKKEIRLRIRDDYPVSSFSQLARETVWYGRNRRETDYTSTHYVVEYSEL